MIRSRARAIRTSSLLLISLFAASCATLRVPESAPSFKPDEFVRAAESGLVLEARPIADRESYWDLFEEDLPKLGIVAIWVNIRNDGEGTVFAGSHSWRLRASGREYRLLNADELFERYYDARRIRAFSVQNDQEARDGLRGVLLDVIRPLRAGESRSGFVFFRTRPGNPTAWTHDARLVLRDARMPERKRLTLELPLNYATP